VRPHLNQHDENCVESIISALQKAIGRRIIFPGKYRRTYPKINKQTKTKEDMMGI
jgi:hypothetical protein